MIGMAYLRPQMMAAMRGIKAEGGWGVVCTEYCSIHPSSDDMPFPRASMWDKGDIKNLRLMTDAVHAHDSLNAPIRCTQNPTMGEEWRRGWHPEHIAKQPADESVLVIGSGPTGLEAACALGQSGYAITIAEAERELGGRINQESCLPGMSEVARVRDWHLGHLAKMDHMHIYPSSLLDAEAILELSPTQLEVIPY